MRLTEKKVDALTLEESERLVVPVSDLRLGEDNEVSIARGTTPGRLYYTMHLRYFPPTEEVEAANYGVAVSREYLAVDGGEQGASPERSEGIDAVGLGEMVKVRLTVVAPTDLH